MIYVGIDNGVSGTIGVITQQLVEFLFTPSVITQDYTKKRQNVSRLDFCKFVEIISRWGGDEVKILMERPVKNPGMFSATVSSVRCFEAQLIALEQAGIPPHECIDSKEWQKKLLPQPIGKGETKKLSVETGCRLYPQFEQQIRKHKDADGLLIAHYCMLKYKIF